MVSTRHRLINERDTRHPIGASFGTVHSHNCHSEILLSPENALFAGWFMLSKVVFDTVRETLSHSCNLNFLIRHLTHLGVLEIGNLCSVHPFCPGEGCK